MASFVIVFIFEKRWGLLSSHGLENWSSRRAELGNIICLYFIYLSFCFSVGERGIIHVFYKEIYTSIKKHWHLEIKQKIYNLVSQMLKSKLVRISKKGWSCRNVKNLNIIHEKEDTVNESVIPSDHMHHRNVAYQNKMG